MLRNRPSIDCVSEVDSERAGMLPLASCKILRIAFYIASFFILHSFSIKLMLRPCLHREGFKGEPRRVTRYGYDRKVDQESSGLCLYESIVCSVRQSQASVVVTKTGNPLGTVVGD